MARMNSRIMLAIYGVVIAGGLVLFTVVGLTHG
jgi:hypothetical protein